MELIKTKFYKYLRGEGRLRMLCLDKVSCYADFSYQSQYLFHQYILKIVHITVEFEIYRN